MTEINHSFPKQTFFFMTHDSVHSPVDDNGSIRSLLKQSTGLLRFLCCSNITCTPHKVAKVVKFIFQIIFCYVNLGFFHFCIENCRWKSWLKKKSIANLPETAIQRKTSMQSISAIGIDCASTWDIKVSPMICEICQIHSKHDKKKNSGSFLLRDKRIFPTSESF